MLLKRPDGYKMVQKLLNTVWVRTDDARLSSIRAG